MYFFAVTILVPAVILAKAPGHDHGHNHGYVTDNPLHINNEIQDLNIHFGTHFCLDLLVVDCHLHNTTNDEQICGTDGHTYANHCEFAHAMCMFSHLRVKSHGPCNSATRPPTTVASGSTMPPATTSMPPATTMMPTDTTTIMTNAPTVEMTTPAMSTTTTQSQETVLFQQVFCRNKDFIHCPTTVTPTCASNGMMFNSGCEFSKAKCADITLTQVDVSMCSTPVVG
ncbi:uncharacterized protein LOC133204879 [Saccostrea echinata]|uniref:uncharacterized protein LOC133204879 n=1 Tax=Saccostrea echinata TaxID=191078 RepID=UPI002A8094D9|nr:uncharacterized protein LOC133204879 [Saccostrea echinata]